MKSLRFSLRYLSKARGGNITRVVSLTLGLAVSLLIFSYVSYLISFNRCFPEHSRIYQLWTMYASEGQTFSPLQNYPAAPAMRQDMPQVESATRILGTFSFDMKVDESSFPCILMATDTSFFDVFGIKVLSGDDPHRIFATSDQIMISKSFAETAFSGENPIGRKVIVRDRFEFTVAGVFKDIPSNTSFGEFNLLLPLDYFVGAIGFGKGWNGGDSYQTFLKLKKGTRIADVEAQIPAFAEKYGKKRVFKEWKAGYVFSPIVKSLYVSGSTLKVVILLSALAFLLLFVATMNYVLISISGMVSRSRAIALLKCNGAHRDDVFRIFLAETVILVLCGLVLAVLLLVACTDPIKQLTSNLIIDGLFSWRRIWTPVSVVLLAFLLSGLIPAYLFTKVPVAAAFKWISDSNRKWKKVLLGVEVACVTCVAALLWIFSLQFDFLRYGDFGYEPEGLIYTQISGHVSQSEQYVKELEALPEVESVANAYGYALPIKGYSGMPCVDENTHKVLFSCRWDVVDMHYIPVMKMEMVEGSNFTEESSALDVIVNQEYVRQRGWTDSPVGHQIIDSEKDHPRVYNIVGVVKDFRTGSMGEVEPLVMHYACTAVPDEFLGFDETYTIIRLHELSQMPLDAVREKIKTLEGASDVYVYTDDLQEYLSSVRSSQVMIAVGPW